ncbi:MAG: ATP-binding protein [Acidobacteria bacterium]|nr:MAG: ATP-binding protein [Acidobacteriota bacterium]
MTTAVDPQAYKGWSPAAQAKALEKLQAARNEAWRPFYCPDAACNGKPHDVWEWNHARADQRPPTDADWLVWLLKSGRGAGKTRAGSEYTHRMANVTHRLAIVGATGADVRDIMLEGESGLLTIAAPDFRPAYEPSKRRLTWPNGAVGTTYSAEEPDRLRGPEHGYAWIDEPAHWALIQEAWDNLLFGLRIGRRPRICATTTPKPRKWMKEVTADPRTRLATASTYDNIDNLAPTFAEIVIARYEGTRLGRQEIHGELLDDIEGALWTYDLIEPDRLPFAPELTRVVVAVDPAGTANKTSDETGIIVVGFLEGHLYVLADRSGRYSPLGWAKAVDAVYDEFAADAVVAEKNYGGDMVRHTLQSAGVTKRIILVTSRRGKAIRAEPIVGVYEQHKVHHVGIFPELEEEMTSWRPYEDNFSPNRLDALVHGATNLLGRHARADIATPASLRQRAESAGLSVVAS